MRARPTRRRRRRRHRRHERLTRPGTGPRGRGARRVAGTPRRPILQPRRALSNERDASRVTGPPRRATSSISSSRSVRRLGAPSGTRSGPSARTVRFGRNTLSSGLAAELDAPRARASARSASSTPRTICARRPRSRGGNAMRAARAVLAGRTRSCARNGRARE